MKLPSCPPMLEAMALDADLSTDADLRDICSYYLLFFARFRIGTATASPHALTFQDLLFSPSLALCDVVLICVRSSKTRPRAAGLPFWTAISRQPSMPFCPAQLLQLHFLRGLVQLLHVLVLTHTHLQHHCSSRSSLAVHFSPPSAP